MIHITNIAFSLSVIAPIGDIVFHQSFGNWEIVGTRLHSLVVKYKCGIRIARPNNNECLMLTHVFTDRDGRITIQIPTVDGVWILVDQIQYERIDPGSIVLSNKHGFGQFLGCVENKLVVAFLKDRGAAPFVKYNRISSIIRSKQSPYSGWIGVNHSSITVDPNENMAGKLRFLSGDLVRIRRQSAGCLGTTRIGDQASLVFETDDMLFANLGVGVFSIGKMIEGELIARIGAAGKRRMKMATGESIELSINTSDFLNLPLLPLDRILADGRIRIVVGDWNGILIRV
jgi:hypothetical protein